MSASPPTESPPWGRYAFLGTAVVPIEEASVSVLDRGLLRGEGVFEALRTYAGVPFAVRRHLDRMEESARTTLLALPERMILRRAVEETAAANDFLAGGFETRIQLTVTAGPGGPGPDPFGDPDPTVIAIATRLPTVVDDTPLTALTLPWMRHESAVLTGVKPTSYLDHLVGKKWARQNGADEGVWTNSRGQITEATGANLFVVREGAVVTPPLEAGLLAGVTRDLVLDRCRERGVPVLVTPLTREDVLSADECFITSTPREAVAISTLDGTPIGTGERPVFSGVVADFRRWAPAHPDP
ncbi:MAG: aminotransferase class IV [Acidimicrobiia bacterium]|nr:aminotransferase class IV [Acidimicrobiia bacterium]